jgi:hypothetical protein
MSKRLELQVRENVLSYLIGDLKLADLHAWLAPISWGLGNSDLSSFKQLVNDVSLLLDEYSYGHWTEDELRRELANLLILKTSADLSAWKPYVFTTLITTSVSSQALSAFSSQAPVSWKPASQTKQPQQTAPFRTAPGPVYELSAAS